MSEIAIMTDSNCGIMPGSEPRPNIHIIPMPVLIDGEIFFEGTSITTVSFYQKLSGGSQVSTSLPSPWDVISMWTALLKSYDEIVYIPMSSGLSGSCQTAMLLAEDYEGKVYVVNNQRISVTQMQSVLDARDLIKKGYAAAQIRNILEETKFDSSIYVTVTTLKYLKKGGRITPAAAMLGTLLQIKPVLTIQGEKLDAFSKARTLKQGKTIMMTALKKDLETRFHDPEARHTWLEIAYTCSDEMAQEFKETVAEIYPDANICIAPLSLSIACHIGPGCLAVACSGHLKELE